LHNILLESGRQMAFTAPVPPAQLEGIAPRLATRLSGGPVIELGIPDREARQEEVRRWLGPAASDGDLVEYLASRQASSLREVQQLVQRVEAAADERGVPLTLENARRILDGDPSQQVRPPRRGSGDRKSTRLNSSHVKISYAVFCLKKKIKARLCRYYMMMCKIQQV